MDTLFQIDLTAPAEKADAFTAFLFEEIAYGWEETQTDAGVRFRVHIETPASMEAFQAKMRALWPDVEVEYKQTPKRDWTLAWREFFTAVPCGGHFIVIAPWMAAEQPFPERTPIIIEPKMAFGTGHHPTTALCLGTASELFAAGRLRPGMRFLDLGTGSGILGLGCAKLGLHGLGLDIDPLAIENALENKGVNQVGDAFEVRVGGVETLPKDEPFDCILANILAEPLIDLAPQIVSRLKPGGVLVLSGLLVIQAEKVLAAYTAQGLTGFEQRDDGEWAALILS